MNYSVEELSIAADELRSAVDSDSNGGAFDVIVDPTRDVAGRATLRVVVETPTPIDSYNESRIEEFCASVPNPFPASIGPVVTKIAFS